MISSHKKGFSATPVIFLGLFLITGLLILNFSDVERRVVEGIGKENEAHKLYSDFIENKTSRASLLLTYTLDACSEGTTETSIETAVGGKLSGSVDVYGCNEKSFFVNNEYGYDKELQNSNINRDVVVEQKITCDIIFELKAKKPKITCSSGTVDCSS